MMGYLSTTVQIFYCLVIILMCSGLPLLWKPGDRSNQRTKYEMLQDDRPLKLHEYSSYQKRVIVRDATLKFNLKTLKALKRDKISFTCEICKALVSVIQTLFKQGETEDEIVDVLTKICVVLRIESVRICPAITREFKVEVLTVLAEVVLGPGELCGLVFGSQCAHTYDPFGNWSVTFPQVKKPPVVPPSLPKSGSPVIRILHISDIHYDRFYKEGSNALCGEPLCCRADDGPPSSQSAKAGKWGDYRHCDTPLITLENLLLLLNTSHDYDFVLWTGDLPAHDVWNQTRADQLELVKTLAYLFQKYLPSVPIYPALGNHESAPVNSFPPPFINGSESITWLYNALAESWKTGGRLPADAVKSVKMGAFYTVSPFPGFRIISLNTNFCNNMNWWLFINTTDPAGELQWLVNVLQQAEDKKEKVHIIGHIPPGKSDCLQMWSWNYYKIINRYESTITGQFFGHTHKDSYEMFYDMETLKRPVSVAYIVGSITPYDDLNPGYRIYQADGNYTNSSWAILDHTNYILNLTEANMNPDKPPTWHKEYSAKAAYDMPSLFPSEWDKLIDKLKTNETLFQLFYKHYKKSNVKEGECDAKCETEILCDLRSGKSHDPAMCNDLNY